MGDTEKEADPVGGSGGTEDGGVEGWRGGCGRSRLGCGQIENVPDSQRARQTQRHYLQNCGNKV